MSSRFGRKLARLQEARTPTTSAPRAPSSACILDETTAAVEQHRATDLAPTDAQRAARLQRLRKAQLLARAPGPLKFVPQTSELDAMAHDSARLDERGPGIASSDAHRHVAHPSRAPELPGSTPSTGRPKAGTSAPPRALGPAAAAVATASATRGGQLMADRLRALAGIGLETTDGKGNGPGALLHSAVSHDTPHGHTALGAWPKLDAATETAAFAALGMAGARLEDLLFFDTETTGLAGGTGTVPFLVGFGYVADGHFIVEQHLLPDLGFEEPLLGRFAAALERRPYLVSFNGKSFDWPLVRTRAQLAQQPLGTPAAHCDLLHIARRLFRAETEHFRLSALERAILGFERFDDLPSAQVPERYFDYLRTRDAQPLAAVLKHNFWDILSLLRLLSESVAAFCPLHSEGLTSSNAPAHAGEHNARRLPRSAPPTARAESALIAWRHGQRALAMACFDGAERALDKQPTATLSPMLWRFGATLVRRTHSPEVVGTAALQREEARLLRGLASAQARMDAATEHAAHNQELRRDLARSHLALAKFYEHRMRDQHLARLHAVQSAGGECALLHQRRLARLGRSHDAVQVAECGPRDGSCSGGIEKSAHGFSGVNPTVSSDAGPPPKT